MVGSTAVSSDKGVVMGGLSWSGQRPSPLDLSCLQPSRLQVTHLEVC